VFQVNIYSDEKKENEGSFLDFFCSLATSRANNNHDQRDGFSIDDLVVFLLAHCVVTIVAKIPTGCRSDRACELFRFVRGAVRCAQHERMHVAWNIEHCLVDSDNSKIDRIVDLHRRHHHHHNDGPRNCGNKCAARQCDRLASATANQLADTGAHERDATANAATNANANHANDVAPVPATDTVTYAKSTNRHAVTNSEVDDDNDADPADDSKADAVQLVVTGADAGCNDCGADANNHLATAATDNGFEHDGANDNDQRLRQHAREHESDWASVAQT